MEQVLLAYGFLRETDSATIMLYKQWFSHLMEMLTSSTLLLEFSKEIH